jgi:ecotin
VPFTALPFSRRPRGWRSFTVWPDGRGGHRWARGRRDKGSGRVPGSPGALASALAGALLAVPLASPPALAATAPDLRPYPPAAPSERRWFITVDGAGADLRVELLIGRTLMVDCNRHGLQGSLEEESVPGWGYPMFRVKGGRQQVSTRMACPDQAPRREFVTLGGTPTLVPVNPRLPIVVVAPKELEVRWRLWRAEPKERNARPF